MTKLAIRHGFSDANNRENYGTPAFDNPTASLTDTGRVQAYDMGTLLLARYRINLAEDTVAVSELRRTQDTALGAGFRRLHVYSELNEEKGGYSDTDIRIAIDTERPPKATILAARRIIEHPPEEEVWIGSALLFATICQELGIYTNERFLPKFCEIRELPL